MLYQLFRGINLVLNVFQMAMVVYCIMTWLPALQNNRFFGVLRSLAEPFTRPFRGISEWIMRKTGLRLDFSMLFSLIALEIAGRLLWRVYAFLA